MQSGPHRYSELVVGVRLNREKSPTAFASVLFELIAEVKTEHRSCRRDGCMALKTRISSEVETWLSFIREMRISKWRRGSHFTEETRLCQSWDAALLFYPNVSLRMLKRCCLCSGDADFSLMKRRALLNARFALWAHCHVSGGAWRDVTLLELRCSSLVLPKRELENTEEMLSLQWRCRLLLDEVTG